MEEEIKSCKILIIDDKASNVDLLLQLMDNLGYQSVTSITDSRIAMETIDSFQPDILLLDLMMPVVSGFDILKLIQSDPAKYSNLKVLVLTADITLPTKQKALALGAHDFLTKPFDLIEASLRIKNLLWSAYLYKQLENQNQLLEIKVAERTKQLQKSNEAIKVQMEALKEIAWMQSHIVRAPVARILGLVSILTEPDTSLELIKETLTKLEMSAKELDNVVKEITEKTYIRGMFD
ncbi:MAG: response regulator [Mongoliitalea sp.]